MDVDQTSPAAASMGCGGTRRAAPGLLIGITIAFASSVTLAGCQSAAPQARSVPSVRALQASPAPAGWQHAALPGGGGVLSYPPSMHLVSGDKGEVSAAQLTSSGGYVMYLNVTPKQGAESLANWPAFRVNHLKEDTASTVKILAESHRVRFNGGTGSCVIDAYVTKVKSNHYTELACFVQGRTSASVIVAAAPTVGWGAASGQLRRAVAAYQVR